MVTVELCGALKNVIAMGAGKLCGIVLYPFLTVHYIHSLTNIYIYICTIKYTKLLVYDIYDYITSHLSPTSPYTQASVTVSGTAIPPRPCCSDKGWVRCAPSAN